MGIVFDLSSGVGWFEGILVGNFGKFSANLPESIDSVGLNRIVSNVLAEKVVVGD